MLNKSIRHAVQERFGLKVLASFVAVIVVSLTVYTVLGALREGDKIKTSLAEKGDLFARILARGSVVGIFAENTGLLREAAEGILSQKDVLSVAMYNSDLKVLYAAENRIGSDPQSEELPPGTDASPQVSETADVFEFIQPVSSQSLPGTDESVYLGPARAGAAGRVIGYVRIVLSKGSYRKEIFSLVARNAVMMLLFIVASAVIVWFAVKKVMRPLDALTRNVKALEKGMPVEQMPVETRDEIGKLASAFNIMVLARGKAEDSLRESEERYRRLVELSPDAIYVQQEGEFVFLNAAGTRLLGASGYSELLGRKTQDFIHDESRNIVNARLGPVELEGAVVSPLAIRYLRLDKTVVDAEVAAAPLTYRGRQAVLVIARDITERKGMEETIRNYQQQLYSVASEMSSLESRIEERERHLIAADLHDHVGQNLAVSNFKLGALRKSLATPEAVRHLDEVRELLGQTIDYTRSLTVELNPPILVEIGFRAAVDALAEGFRKTYGIAVSVHDDGRTGRIRNDARYLLFRCVRELLMNVAKHARASCADITMTRDEDEVRIVIVDDGIGFDMTKAAGKKDGFGLFSIRERMKRLGGSFEIESSPGSGTRMVLAAPLER